MSNQYYIVGATDDWTVTKYKDVAKAKAQAHKGTTIADRYLVVAVNPKGEGVESWGYIARDLATGKYDVKTTNPGKAAYVAVFDLTATDGEPFDEGFFVASQEVYTRTTRQSAAGWILGGVASLFGLMALSKKKGR